MVWTWLVSPLKASGVTTGVPGLSGAGISPGSLNRCQYHLRVWEGKFPSLNKGRGSRGCRAPPEVGCVTGGTSSPGFQVLSVLVTSCPPSSTKILLDDSPCPRNQHNEVWPARAEPAQQDVELREDTRMVLGSGCSSHLRAFLSSRGRVPERKDLCRG
ncbi:hypothetical protein B296_00040021, partial [Ensete ventricosum]